MVPTMFKKALAAGAIAATAAAGVGVSYAATNPDTPSATSGSTPNSAQDTRHVRHPRLVRAAMNTAADTIGISVADLRSALRDGKTVADVASEHGVEAQAVVDAIVSKGTQRIDEALANGEITQAQADQAKAKLATAAATFVNETPHPRPGIDRRRVRQGVLKTAADTIGVSEADLRAALRDGQSIADVATAHGVEPQTVVDALVAAGTQHIDQALANGRITQERADAAKAKLAERAAQVVDAHRGTDAAATPA